MRTRSQTNLFNNSVTYYGDFVFDFDDASAAWNSNKKKLDNACYIYICGYIKTKGKKCMNKTNCGELCRFHKNK